MNTLYSTYINRIAACLFILTVTAFPSLQAQNTDLPNPTPNIQTAPVGTWVIAMDNALQSNPGYFNVKAYGLVVKILNAERPVRWVIQSGKPKDGVDFSAMASRVFPSPAVPAILDFKAGPFLVFPQDTAGLTAVIQMFNDALGSTSRVNVYQLTAPAQVDVRYLLTQKPRGAVLNDGNNAKIHASYYIKAGIDSPMNWRVTNASNLVGQCYTFASEPHSNVVGPTIDSIRNYVLGGGNFLAQCQAVGTFENAATGRFHTTSGITTANQSTTPNYAYPNADLSFSQYEGRFDPMLVGGAQRNWRKSTGSSFINDHHTHQSGAFPSDTSVIGQAVAKLSSGRGHLVFYTGGHDYNKNNSIDQVNGMRSFFNAFITPSGFTQCDFLTSATDIAVQKTVNDASLCIGDTTFFRIVVRNVGSTAAGPAPVTVQDVFPSAGFGITSFSSSTGTFSTATGTWNVGTMLPGASETLLVNVTAINAGLFVNTAYADNYPGDNTFSNDTSSVTVQIFAPQVVTLPAVTACGSYTLPWGTVVTSSGSYSNTIPSVNGCDSTQTVNVAITGGSAEICNGLDDDCNGSVDDGLTYTTYYTDSDNDGYGTGPGTSLCSNPGVGFAIISGDCDDGNPAISPGATEICNGLDDDCNGSTDDGLTFTVYYTDNDLDDYGTGAGTSLCSNPGAGYSKTPGDCNDSDASINPGATESCNGLDDDCDGQIDEGLTTQLYYTDVDGDGYGDEDVNGVSSCSPVSGSVTNNDDCEDGNIAINPAAVEICNGLDDDCDGQIDEETGDPLGNVIGTGIACVPLAGGTATFSVPPAAGVSSYFWTLPPGATVISGQNTSSITIGWTTTVMHNTGIIGTLSVTGAYVCGTSAPSSIQLDLNFTVPVRPPSPSGPSRVCQGDVATYSISPVSRTRSYFWTTPPGMVITSGQGTNIIQVSVGNTYTGGDLTVEARNSCGSSPVRIKNLGLALALTPDPISGPSSGVCGTSGVVYSTAGSANSASYMWTVPAGVSITGGQGTKSITVDISSSFGTGAIAVQGINSCGPGASRSLSIQGKPFIAGSISGTQNICPGASVVPYSIATVSGATAYAWTPPGGSVVSTGQGTKNILVSYGLTEATNQNLAVRASNSCGVSNAKTLGGITISSSFCGLRLADTHPGTGIRFGLRPNPVKDLVVVDIRLQDAAELTIRFTDVTGRLVHIEQTELPEGGHTLLRDVSYLPSGIYAVTLESPLGQVRQMMLVE